MNKNKLSLILAVAAAASSAMAATVTESSGIVPATFNPGNATPILPGGEGTLANSPAINLPVNSFNATLGTLNSVTYTLTYYSYATYDLLNTGVAAATFEVQWRVGRDLDGDRNSLQIPGNGTQFSFSALGTRFVNVPPIPPNTTGATPYITDTSTAGSPLGNIVPFIGDGVTFVFTPKGFSGVFASQQAVPNNNPDVFVAAKVDVEYRYTETGVPEASTYAAGAVVLAGAGMILRRRMVAAKA
jgi:hypothetical protein